METVPETRAYLSFCLEVLMAAVTDGALDADDYCFEVIARGYRRLEDLT